LFCGRACLVAFFGVVLETLFPTPPRRDKATAVESSHVFWVLGRREANGEGMDLEWQLTSEMTNSVSLTMDLVVFPVMFMVVYTLYG
jgi:hypothetical protein